MLKDIKDPSIDVRYSNVTDISTPLETEKDLSNQQFSTDTNSNLSSISKCCSHNLTERLLPANQLSLSIKDSNSISLNQKKIKNTNIKTQNKLKEKQMSLPIQELTPTTEKKLNEKEIVVPNQLLHPR